MDSEPLSRHRLFCTGDAEEARVRMGGILRDHRLDPGDGVLDARCDYLGVGHVGLAHLQYGVEVRVRSEPTETFRLVHLQRILGRPPQHRLRMSQAMQLRSPTVRAWLETLRMVHGIQPVLRG
ncbi:hypothetical protein [Nocardia cyriacigeorgica]|uniref:AraC-like ligand-binding domain-containing protein n=1 Tax=Nocardia cyriacigeorgica TaxID=135487 RepID=UPI001895FCB1|nr:hypothetical protein [Nocardia cyriacigeorgica]MBF6286313.1 hypothetical protein [Nocardia cyriacigeorgica]